MPSKAKQYDKLSAFFEGGEVTPRQPDKLSDVADDNKRLFSPEEREYIEKRKNENNRAPASKPSIEEIEGGEIEFQVGGRVPDIPNVPGNSPKNDTVAARLSPGEVVLPRSVTQTPDAPDEAKRFMKLHHYFGANK